LLKGSKREIGFNLVHNMQCDNSVYKTKNMHIQIHECNIKSLLHVSAVDRHRQRSRPSDLRGSILMVTIAVTRLEID
jgi:hypothetical protein